MARPAAGAPTPWLGRERPRIVRSREHVELVRIHHLVDLDPAGAETSAYGFAHPAPNPSAFAFRQRCAR
jgi:hypothetical protein